MTFKISDLKRLGEESGLSPEQLAEPMQISPATLRRLLKRPDSESLPKAYETLVDEGVYRLIIDGKLSSESSIAQAVLLRGSERSFDAAIHALGFPEAAMARGSDMEDRITIGLSQIGSSDKHQKVVRESKSLMDRFEQLGKDWSSKLRTLRKIVGSKELSTIEKFAAYGALFYLITPADLIPDTIPVFGLVDDFSIICIVVAYYLSRYPWLRGGSSAAGGDHRPAAP